MIADYVTLSSCSAGMRRRGGTCRAGLGVTYRHGGVACWVLFLSLYFFYFFIFELC